MYFHNLVSQVLYKKRRSKTSSLKQLELNLLLGSVVLPWKDCCLLTLALNCTVKCLETGALFSWCFWVFKSPFIKERWQLSFQINSFRGKKSTTTNHKQTKSTRGREGKALSSHNTKIVLMLLEIDSVFNSFLTSESEFSKPGVLFHCLRGNEFKALCQKILNTRLSIISEQARLVGIQLPDLNIVPALEAPVQALRSLQTHPPLSSAHCFLKHRLGGWVWIVLKLSWPDPVPSS